MNSSPQADERPEDLELRFRILSAEYSALIFYLGSTWLPRDARPLLALARRRRVPVVVNQSGVAYPGWAGHETEAINRRFRAALLAADHVLYQSEFCKRSADEFLGPPRGTWEVLYNAVDVAHFTPRPAPASTRSHAAGLPSCVQRSTNAFASARAKCGPRSDAVR